MQIKIKVKVYNTHSTSYSLAYTYMPTIQHLGQWHAAPLAGSPFARRKPSRFRRSRSSTKITSIMPMLTSPTLNSTKGDQRFSSLARAAGCGRCMQEGARRVGETTSAQLHTCSSGKWQLGSTGTEPRTQQPQLRSQVLVASSVSLRIREAH